MIKYSQGLDMSNPWVIKETSELAFQSEKEKRDGIFLVTSMQ